MQRNVPEGPLMPPPGRPNWAARSDLPLAYLGWGQRDYSRHPLAMHYDRGTNYYLLLRGEVTVDVAGVRHVAVGPTALVFDPGCTFGITQNNRRTVEILVWIWQGRAGPSELRPEPGKHLVLDLRHHPLDSLIELHTRCRAEVSLADGLSPRALTALRELVEVELLRASQAAIDSGDVRWKLAHSWMTANLAIHAPVPALCDYLQMSSSTLHRFFRAQTGLSPGAYFHQIKLAEARRLIEKEGWQVKRAAYHLGYSHPNDLSRAMAATP